ncbi:uncharacterized protein COLE_07867 [Cutaneotrichosporon oleaginosum]|uniref:uncharacterized protein n=1 Tax=Cutaneotrichosporon oleaginosum TaxID=879819 RepID=UPI00132B1191|nr:hypothetical protein COLE_07867 [Cutaneotrichosporon oleaginosum]
MVTTLETPPSHITLPSGDRMPSLGLGCWQAPPEQLSRAVAHALSVGYRHIDGATVYANEEALGAGVAASGVPRSQIWITTKLWNTDHRPKDVRPALEKSLAALGTEYVDLWLMHYPCAMDPDTEEIKVVDVDYVETWKAMEACVNAGLARNIGVSKRFHGLPPKGFGEHRYRADFRSGCTSRPIHRSGTRIRRTQTKTRCRRSKKMRWSKASRTTMVLAPLTCSSVFSCRRDTLSFQSRSRLGVLKKISMLSPSPPTILKPSTRAQRGFDTGIAIGRT